MAFLFKSKKSHDRSLASRDGNSGSQGSIQSQTAKVAKDEKAAAQRATPTGSLNSHGDEPNNEQKGHRQRGSSVDQSDLPIRNGTPQGQAPVQQPQQGQGPPVSNPNAALYPWSQRRLNYTSSHPSPFPRYGAAVNSVSSKEGDVYLMGGLINSSTVKGDLWLIEAGQSMSCYPLGTTAEGPGPRVGHSSLLVGNAFIVYGGDTKVEESDVLDETLYLLNTSTRQWSRALPAGPRPSGRYGHSLNILGSKIYIFGGQIEGYFMNDLSAFDLNQLQMPNNRWEMLIQNSDSGGPPPGKVPPARTNHSMVTFNDKMYLFGGTNGYQWFNDVWCYDPALNEWSQLDCIGYIPVPREGHAAALVDDVMYIFGGRTEEGTDLGDLAAFRITSRRWYTFQNMGPSPSPRSGHSMTTVGKAVVVVGGEPSTAPANAGDLGIAFVLDTTKIRYPNDAPAQQRVQQSRRPSVAADNRPIQSRDGSQGPPDARRIAGPQNGVSSPSNGLRGSPNPNEMSGGPGPAASKLPRSTQSPPVGPPPPAPNQIKSAQAAVRSRGVSAERETAAASPQLGTAPSAVPREAIIEEAPVMNGRRTPTGAPAVAANVSKSEPSQADAPKQQKPRQGRSQGSVDSNTEPGLKAMQSQQPQQPQQAQPQSQPQPQTQPQPRQTSPPPPNRSASNPMNRRSSNRNSQTVALLKELDSARNRNAWYASELELARKSGYAPNGNMSPLLDRGSSESFDDEDKPLVEALLAMRTELANVQSSVDKQAVVASKQIAEAEKQRDVAVQEAVYAKAKLAAHMGGSAASTPQLDGDRDSDERTAEMSKKLASTLNFQKELQGQLETLKLDLEAEKRARQLADDTSNAAQKRATELESYKTVTSTELERLKAELHIVQREAREQAVQHSEMTSAMQLLRVEKDDLQNKYDESVGSSKEQNQTFDSLREAVAASAEMKMLLERKLEEERSQREKMEAKLNKLKTEHEARTAELVAATQRLRDAEEMAEKHANEAKTHRQAVLAGFDKMTTRDVASSSKEGSERLETLQAQLNSANALVKKYQEEADTAADKLRTAEERIAGLEVYQEQSSREGVAIRRQLQAALKDTQSLQATNSDLKNQLQHQQLETNAMAVQHNALKNILIERGISPSGTARSRSANSPRVNSPNDQARIRELEEQLSQANNASEEAAQRNAAQLEATESSYRDKLTQLENDYQSAVHYVKGTEKMLKQLKDQLARYKSENQRLKSENEELEERAQSATAGAGGPEWENERSVLQKKIESLQEETRTASAELENQLQSVRAELEEVTSERDTARKHSEEATRTLGSNRRDLDQLQQENSELERRAQDAEHKVSMLLDQFETSVDNYRRQSRQVPSIHSDMTATGNTNGVEGHGHSRQDSNDTMESGYTGTTGIDARNSTALDNLASELETLRSHWETTSKNYRMSNTFDFDTATTPTRKDDEGGLALSESLADWRKRLDVEEKTDSSDGAKSKSRSDRS